MLRIKFQEGYARIELKKSSAMVGRFRRFPIFATLNFNLTMPGW